MSTNKLTTTLQIANILGFILVITLNTLAITLPIGGRTTGEISDLYPNLFVPAGYAFSIWSLIYTLLIVFIIMQSKGVFSKTKPGPDYVHTIGWWFVISCLANASWILAWHYLLAPLSLLLMLLILASLIAIYQRLGIGQGQKEVPFFIRLPFSVYLGWITVATIANVTAVLVSIQWNGFGVSEVSWTVIMLCVGGLVGSLFLWFKKDIAYVLVIVWAFWAIAVKRQSIGEADETIIITTIYGILGLFVIIGLLRFLFIKRLA
ncbi:MAG: hypothetical protein R2828_03345 [Saprospiraceae bacterium]